MSAYVGSNHATCLDSRRSVSGGAVVLAGRGASTCLVLKDAPDCGLCLLRSQKYIVGMAEIGKEVLTLQYDRFRSQSRPPWRDTQ